MIGGYREDVLKKLQRISFEMLKELNRICEKYNIQYFCAFGTAIGAVRHKGFIPWDDDIDVGMMREEYEKLRNVPKTEWGDKYILADSRDKCAFHRTIYPRIYIKNTIFETESEQKDFPLPAGIRMPIALDIFIFDSFNSLKLKRMIKVTDNYKRFILYSSRKFAVNKNASLNKKLQAVIKSSIYHLMRLFNITSKTVYQKYLKYLNKNKGEFITSFELLTSHQKYACVSKYDEMFPVDYVSFEGVEIPIQKNYDDILSKQYGNYKEMPPKQQQYNHAPASLDFGDGNGDVMVLKDNKI